MLFRPKILSLVRKYSSGSDNAVLARYEKTGNPLEVVKLVNEPLRTLSGGEVKIKMLFSPINPADINMIQGSYPIQPTTLPAIGGNEGIAQVVEVGPYTKNLKIGDLVFPLKQGFGTWRTFATCSENDLFSFNPGEGVPLEYLASLTINPATAYRMLEDFVTLKEGDVIIQNGANSMVGNCVIQLAAAKGVKTINIVRQRSDFPEMVEKLKGYGAYIVISDDYIKKINLKI